MSGEGKILALSIVGSGISALFTGVMIYYVNKKFQQPAPEQQVVSSIRNKTSCGKCIDDLLVNSL